MEPERQPVQSRAVAAVMAVVAVAAFLSLASPRLAEQGLYYDELHQATASFAYLGQPAPMFNVEQVLGLPVLNMHYSGAIKTGMYGTYMRLTGARFSVLSWRWLGLLLAAAGLGAFCLIARGVSPLTTGLVALLVVTDANLLLSVRHDWGPVALSLALRLVLLGVMLRRGQTGPGPGESAIIGVLTGLIVFEKLSGAVVVAPVAAIVLLCGSGPLVARVKKFGLGMFVGLLPLVYLNTASLLVNGDLVSLRNVPEKVHMSLAMLVTRAAQYVQIGAGEIVQDFILGRTLTWTPVFEGCALTGAIIATVWAARGVSQAGHGRTARLVLALLATWLAVGIELPMLPSPTGVHHWVLGTPFQYVALAITVGWLLDRDRGMATQKGRLGLVALLVAVVLVGRAPGVTTLERDLASGAASVRFSPSLTRLGEAAGGEPADAMFVATTWGVGTQLVSLSNNQRAVDEAFWGYNPGDLPRLLEHHADKRVFYLVAFEALDGIPSKQREIQSDFASSPVVVEEPLPPSLTHLAGIDVRRYVRR